MFQPPSSEYFGLIGFHKPISHPLHPKPEVLQSSSIKLPSCFYSSTTNPNGRFVIVTGHINSLPVTLVNIYGPTTDDSSFFCKVFDLIPDDDSSYILIGGDYNCYLDPYLDRQSSALPPGISNVQTINSLIKS